MNKWNSSYTGLRPDLLKYIKESDDNLVLDVGCATGVNGKYLLDHNLADEVFGVEYNSEMAEEARKKGINVLEGDLNDPAFCKAAINFFPLFDFIICGDILEHLYAPEDLLFELSQKLKSNGKILISLPNVAHIELLIQIYFKGSWPMNPRGIFDKTHIRWFTKKDAIQLAKKCGLEVQIYEPKFRARDAIGSNFTWKLNFVKAINKEWVTFQHILVCQRGR